MAKSQNPKHDLLIASLDFSYDLHPLERLSPKHSKGGKPHFRGTKVDAGLFRSPKNQHILRHRSRLEKRWYLALEYDDSVRAFFAEPFRIPYKFNGRTRTYVPDLLVEYADKRLVLVEIKPDALLDEPENRAKFDAAREWCRGRGIQFQVWGEPPPP
jgi:hypothetical protein